jgi:hypothetical protein
LILQVLFRISRDLPLTIEAGKQYQLAENIISKIGKELN